MREKDIEKILVAEVRKLGGRAYKWVSPGNDGVPDRIVIFPGKTPVFVELKTDTGKLSALQAVCGAENRYRETERPPGGPDQTAGGAGAEGICDLRD